MIYESSFDKSIKNTILGKVWETKDCNTIPNNISLGDVWETVDIV